MDGQSFSVSKGDLITTKSSSYLVEDFLGEGSFGKVARCVETATNLKVAVKIIKNRRSVLASVRQEIHILRSLRALDPERCGIVRWMGALKHGPHFCLVFELLDQSLLDFAHQTANHCLPLMQIKNIVEQLASALDHLGTLGIIHGDLKPDNVMMTGQDTQVKIIDFGCSLYLSQAMIGFNFGTLWYRSPEVILGLPYTGMVDMWSLGCIAAELLVGDPLYPGCTEYDMWAYIIHTHGELPDAMLDQGTKSHLCFTKGSLWRLKTQREYKKSAKKIGVKRRRPRSFFFISLEEVVEVGYEPGHPIPPSFTDLLKRMLHLDCDQRITPHAVLEHPFISPGREIQTDSSCPEPTMVHPYSSSPEPTVDQLCSSSPEPTMVQPYNSSPEPTVDQPTISCPEPTVDQPTISCPEPTVDQPTISFPEPTVDQPTIGWTEPTVDQPTISWTEPTVDQPCSSSPEPTMVQPYNSSPEPSVDQPYIGWTEPTVDQPTISWTEPTVDQPTISCPEPTVDQPTISWTEPTVDQPTIGCTEPSVDQPTIGCTEPTVDQPTIGCTEPTVDQPTIGWTEPTVDQPTISCTEPTVDQPTICFPGPTMVHPYSSSTEPIVDQRCSLPVSHTPSVSEEQRKASVDITDSRKGTVSIPTASSAATETVEVKPAVDNLLDVNPKKKQQKQGRVKRFFKTVMKSFCCCCFAHGDLD